jgi:peptide/nickel transport system substrate-binding protein
MKRSTLMLIGSIVLVSIVGVGCGEAPVPAAPSPTRSLPAAAVSRPLVVAVKTEILTLDPHQNDSYDARKAQHGAYESLLEYTVKDGKVDVGPGLAASVKTDDAKVWILTLQRGVRFMDGAPFNAEAVKYNFDRVRGMKQAPARRLPGIDSVETMDDSTVRITLASAQPAFSENLAVLLMVSPSAAKAHATADDPWGAKWMSDNAVGTGPYRVENWVKGQTVTLVKNPDYWRGWNGSHVEKIILHVVKEAGTRRLLLENGDVDLAEAISVDDLDAPEQGGRPGGSGQRAALHSLHDASPEGALEGREGSQGHPDGLQLRRFHQGCSERTRVLCPGSAAFSGLGL